MDTMLESGYFTSLNVSKYIPTQVDDDKGSTVVVLLYYTYLCSIIF